MNLLFVSVWMYVIVGGASIGSLALLAWMVEGYCEDPWVCAWRGGLV